MAVGAVELTTRDWAYNRRAWPERYFRTVRPGDRSRKELTRSVNLDFALNTRALRILCAILREPCNASIPTRTAVLLEAELLRRERALATRLLLAPAQEDDEHHL